MAQGIAVERLAVAAVAMGVVAPAAPWPRALRHARLEAVVMAVGPFFAAPTLSRRLPETLDGFVRRNRILSVLWCVTALAAVAQTTRLAVFIDAPSRTEFSVLPADTFWRQHSCFSAYIQAADRDRHGDGNVYELPDATYARYRGSYAPLDVDEYLYPPTFLLLPHLTLTATGDFFTLRRGWFAIEIVMCVLGLALVARFIRGREGLRLALSGPGHLAGLPVLLTLQIGNFQLAAFALGMLALVAFESGHAALGGVTLAGLALGKVFPGILVLILIARRQWRPLVCTGIGSLIVLTIAISVVTPATFQAFFSYMLPRLSHGDRFFAGIDSADRLRLAAVNFSGFGFVMKLREFGISVPPWVADGLTWAFTACLTILVWLAAKQGPRRLRLMQVGLAALVLAATAARSSRARTGRLALSG